MLEKRTYPNGVVAFVSPLLAAAGVPHAFSTRVGGVSKGAFDSLNLGNPSGSPIRDADANITANYNRLFEAVGLRGRQLCRVHQVHGRELVLLRPGDTPPHGKQADALLTDSPEMTLSIRTADCVPILAADRKGRLVAAIHAGWRGVVAGVLPATLSAMHHLGIEPKEMVVAIGPCIGLEAFEVGDEVADEFVKAFPDLPPVKREAGRKPHVDLCHAILHQATHFGVPREQVDWSDLCTSRDRKLFYSHRRDAGLTGRLAAVIATRT
jgi:purine-nucleoside/S-methyl-5'-thioadenosine phosphorylase / adenosine deaminase